MSVCLPPVTSSLLFDLQSQQALCSSLKLSNSSLPTFELTVVPCCGTRPSPSVDDWFRQHPNFFESPFHSRKKCTRCFITAKILSLGCDFYRHVLGNKLQTLMACVVKGTLLTMSHVIGRAWKTASQKCRCGGNSAVHRPEILYKSHLSD